MNPNPAAATGFGFGFGFGGGSGNVSSPTSASPFTGVGVGVGVGSAPGFGFAPPPSVTPSFLPSGQVALSALTGNPAMIAQLQRQVQAQIAQFLAAGGGAAAAALSPTTPPPTTTTSSTAATTPSNSMAVAAAVNSSSSMREKSPSSPSTGASSSKRKGDKDKNDLAQNLERFDKIEEYTSNSRTVHIANLPPNVTEQQILDLVSPCGPILYIRIIDHATHCFAFVEFMEPGSAQAAFALNGMPLGDSVLRVNNTMNQPHVKPYIKRDRNLLKRLGDINDRIMKNIEKGVTPATAEATPTSTTSATSTSSSTPTAGSSSSSN